MRIISGKYRGKKLKEFDLKTTKPTTDRVKESIFNLVQFDVDGAVVLDLFSGTGALGIEAISRGAKQTILVDKNKDSIKLIKENLKGIEGDFVVHESDYVNYLNTTTNKFDLVFLDPPYATDYGIIAINMLIKNELLNENAIVIFETSVENNFDLKFENFKIIKKKYGTINVYKLEKLNG